jgi:hypothetical protein
VPDGTREPQCEACWYPNSCISVLPWWCCAVKIISKKWRLHVAFNVLQVAIGACIPYGFISQLRFGTVIRGAIGVSHGEIAYFTSTHALMKRPISFRSCMLATFQLFQGWRILVQSHLEKLGFGPEERALGREKHSQYGAWYGSECELRRLFSAPSNHVCNVFAGSFYMHWSPPKAARPRQGCVIPCQPPTTVGRLRHSLLQSSQPRSYSIIDHG